MPSLELAPRRLTFALPKGGKIVADAWGDDDAIPVIFLHGGGQTRHAWGGTARALAAAGYLTISMDHRGHGESDWAADGDYSTEAFVADLLEIVRQLDRRPFLVGASLGGMTAMMAESGAPSPICLGIVLVDVSPRMELEGVKRIIGFMGARPDGFASLDEAADFVAAYLPHRPRPKDTSGLEKNLRRGEDGRYRWHWDPKLMRRWSPSRFDPRESERILQERLDAARKLRVPSLLIRGRMSDVVTEEAAREYLRLAPGSEYVDLEAAGHMVAGDRNDAFTDAVIDFIRRKMPLSR